MKWFDVAVKNTTSMLQTEYTRFVFLYTSEYYHLLPLNFYIGLTADWLIATAICYGNGAAETVVTDCRKFGHLTLPKCRTAEMYYIG